MKLVCIAPAQRFYNPQHGTSELSFLTMAVVFKTYQLEIEEDVAAAFSDQPGEIVRHTPQLNYMDAIDFVIDVNYEMSL